MKCYGLVENKCEVLRGEEIPKMKDKCGTLECPFFKPEGWEERFVRIDNNFIERKK